MIFSVGIFSRTRFSANNNAVDPRSPGSTPFNNILHGIPYKFEVLRINRCCMPDTIFRGYALFADLSYDVRGIIVPAVGNNCNEICHL